MLDGSSVLRGAVFVAVINAAIATSPTAMQANPIKAIAKRFMALRIQNGIVAIKNAVWAPEPANVAVTPIAGACAPCGKASGA